jgi:hypothetical protein
MGNQTRPGRDSARGVVHCEPPEYWTTIAETDAGLLASLYGDLLGVDPATIAKGRQFFAEDVTHVEPVAGGHTLPFAKGSYNPYNVYNAEARSI